MHAAPAFPLSHDYMVVRWPGVHRLASRIASGRWGLDYQKSGNNCTLSPELCYFALRGNDWLRDDDHLEVFIRSKRLKNILGPQQPMLSGLSI